MMFNAIGHTACQLAIASVISMMAFPPGDVPRQLLVAGSWLVAGIVIGRVWSLPYSRL